MPHVQFVADATENNFLMFCDDVKRIAAWKVLFDDGCRISGLRIQPLSSSETEHKSVVSVANHILCGDPRREGSHLWLFLAHALWQPNDRLVNYRKIWKDEFFKTLSIPLECRGREVRYESKKGVRFATVLSVNDRLFATAAEILMHGDLATWFYRTHAQKCGDTLGQELFQAAFGLEADSSFETHVNWGELIHWTALRHAMIAKRSDELGELRFAIDVFGSAGDVATEFQENGADNPS